MVEFGTRSIGDRREARPSVCEAAVAYGMSCCPRLPAFVMLAKRISLEKATAVHINRLEQRNLEERPSRHQYALAMLGDAGCVDKALADYAVEVSLAHPR